MKVKRNADGFTINGIDIPRSEAEALAKSITEALNDNTYSPASGYKIMRTSRTPNDIPDIYMEVGGNILYIRSYHDDIEAAWSRSKVILDTLAKHNVKY